MLLKVFRGGIIDMVYKFYIDDDSHDAFEEKADNVGTIKVYNESKEDISKNCTVEFFLSKNGMLGLGTELIRLAYNFEQGRHRHLDPVDDELQVQNMGIFLTPESGELIICCEDGKCIDDYI